MDDHFWTHFWTAIVALVVGSGTTGGALWQYLRYQQQRRIDELNAETEQRKDDRTWATDTYRDMVTRQGDKIESLQVALDTAKEERMKLLAENIDLKAELNRWKALTHKDQPDQPTHPPAAPPTSTSC